MSDDSSQASERPAGARMELTPDTIHEEDDGQFLDCPECGSPVSLTRIVEEGHCTGYVAADETETGSGEQVQQPGCTAELSLELVWES